MSDPSLQYAIDGEGKYVLEFVSSGPAYWLGRVSEKFVLTHLEKTTLWSYLNHIHSESLASFSSKLLSSSRSYLEPFIDNDLEEFGEEMFAVAYEDIFDESVSGTRSRLILYNTFVQNLREMTKPQRTKQYAALDISFGPNDDKRTRRTKLYEAFIARLKKMNTAEYALYAGKF